MNEIISKLAEFSKNNPYYIGVNEILESYDHAKSTSKNITTMEAAYSKDSLQAAVHYVKSLQEDYPAIIHRINLRKSRNKNNLYSIFINGITPINCMACKTDYIHAAADNSNNNSVICILCNRYSHKACYNKENITPAQWVLIRTCSIFQILEFTFFTYQSSK